MIRGIPAFRLLAFGKDDFDIGEVGRNEPKPFGGVAYHNLQEAIRSCQVQRRIAQVVEVWILEIGGVVLDYAPDEGQVIVLDGPAEADGHVDPDVGIHG